MTDPFDTDDIAPEPAAAEADCPRCLKPAALCICDTVVPIENRIGLLILQHPQEQAKELGTARLAALHLTNAVFKIGLSWPSLAAALGRPADPKRWAVLYLGSMRPEDFPPGRELVVLDRKGAPLPEQEGALEEIEGVVVLDGTWSQAKTLWWRNAWMLKGRRIALRPQRPSLYGKLRREPRREALSTLESAAFLLSRLEERPEIEAALLASFARMLDRYRATQPARPSRPTGPRPDRRRPQQRRGRGR
ncbi:tRNA-uridine aminocarboxypropyltransferase [Inquilinus limosus]|uniref:tRNA-uridine aminocarboxypropyltransferase n=1 Tax=Inquilinus limosus TaxID=171674 RepID=A0A211ZKB8_9PROT|nr:tRNA-uridine aminocarboxypropyltransferase [Inquilinus limosus]OWJ65527.1 DTW domain-containing protein [Inquilinus limosus]